MQVHKNVLQIKHRGEDILKTYYPCFLAKNVYKRVLSIAEDYYDDIKKIKLVEYDKIYSTPNRSGTSSSISKPVQSIVEQIEKHTRELKRRTKAVEQSLNQFTQEEQNFIKQNIMNKIPIIYCNMDWSERKGKMIRHDFLICLALELGEIEISE